MDQKQNLIKVAEKYSSQMLLIKIIEILEIVYKSELEKEGSYQFFR